LHNISKFFISRIKKKLIIGFSNKSGKNFLGRKTIFTQSGGLKFKNRIIDFKRFIGPLSVLLSVEKDINRTAYVGLVFYNIGIFCYIILPSIKFEIGNLFPGFINFFKKDSSTFLFNIPNGTFIHNIELMVGMGGKISRAAGSSSFIISKDKLFVNLKMHSG
jgi:large subunit ribosomal protein L2